MWCSRWISLYLGAAPLVKWCVTMVRSYWYNSTHAISAYNIAGTLNSPTKKKWRRSVRAKLCCVWHSCHDWHYGICWCQGNSHYSPLHHPNLERLGRNWLCQLSYSVLHSTVRTLPEAQINHSGYVLRTQHSHTITNHLNDLSSDYILSLLYMHF